jgi:uncharacterized protein YqeY
MGPELYDRLKADLREAMRSGDSDAVAVLRTMVSALDNAGAVESDAPSWPPSDGPVEVPRRELTDSDVQELLAREITDLRSSAEGYRQVGAQDEAGRLDAQAALLERYRASG